MNTSDGSKHGITPEDIVRCTKAITKATAKCVSAGISNKQDDIIAAANMSRKAISDMLVIVKVGTRQICHTHKKQNYHILMRTFVTRPKGYFLPN